MTLQEAIKLLKQDLDDPGSVDILDLNKAQELGIEALKEIKAARAYSLNWVNDLLPSETKE